MIVSRIDSKTEAHATEVSLEVEELQALLHAVLFPSHPNVQVDFRISQGFLEGVKITCRVAQTKEQPAVNLTVGQLLQSMSISVPIHFPV